MTVVVTGGTGTLGRVVVDLLEADGHDVRVVSRKSPTWPIDLRTGDGLEAALTGAEVVVHCASTPTARARSRTSWRPVNRWRGFARACYGLLREVRRKHLRAAAVVREPRVTSSHR